MMKPDEVVGGFRFRDLMMYLVPGASLLVALALVGYVLYPTEFEHLTSALNRIDSVIRGFGFATLSYVLGHLLAILPFWVPPWLIRPDPIIEAIKFPGTEPKDGQYKAKIIQKAILEYLKEDEATREILGNGNFDHILHILDKYVHTKAPEAYDFWVARQYAMASLLKGIALSCFILMACVLVFLISNIAKFCEIAPRTLILLPLAWAWYLFTRRHVEVGVIPDRATLDIFYVLSREAEKQEEKP